MIGFVKTSLQSIKDLCQLDFFTKSLTFCFVLIYWLCWAESTASTAALQQKRSDILVVLWQKCQIFKVNYLWLKKFDTKINAILLISDLMASVRKVLRHFYRHGEIFTVVGRVCWSINKKSNYRTPLWTTLVNSIIYSLPINHFKDITLVLVSIKYQTIKWTISLKTSRYILKEI